MEIALFIENFKDCFNETAADSINENTIFRDLEEWNSMMALIIIAMIDAEFGKVLTADNIRESKTVKDLFNCIATQ
ncbi:MAG: acyl carrier protein [Chitinophagales bacterium]|nr:acyl carrier protein [Chitinophagales bacterium]